MAKIGEIDPNKLYSSIETTGLNDKRNPTEYKSSYHKTVYSSLKMPSRLAYYGDCTVTLKMNSNTQADKINISFYLSNNTNSEIKSDIPIKYIISESGINSRGFTVFKMDLKDQAVNPSGNYLKLRIDWDGEWSSNVHGPKKVCFYFGSATIKTTVYTYKPKYKITYIIEGKSYKEYEVIEGNNYKVLPYTAVTDKAPDVVLTYCENNGDKIPGQVSTKSKIFNSWKQGNNSYRGGDTITSIKSNITLTAAFDSPTFILATLISRKVDGSDITTKFMDGKIVVAEKTTKEYNVLTFLGWSIVSGKNTIDYSGGMEVKFSENTSLYACWSSKPDYTSLEVPKISKKPGYSFEGWINNYGDKIDKDTLEITPHKTSTYEAQWKPQGAMYIYDSSGSYNMYQIYIYTIADGWQIYLPHIKEGNEWKLGG